MDGMHVRYPCVRESRCKLALYRPPRSPQAHNMHPCAHIDLCESALTGVYGRQGRVHDAAVSVVPWPPVAAGGPKCSRQHAAEPHACCSIAAACPPLAAAHSVAPTSREAISRMNACLNRSAKRLHGRYRVYIRERYRSPGLKSDIELNGGSRPVIESSVSPVLRPPAVSRTSLCPVGQSPECMRGLFRC